MRVSIAAIALSLAATISTPQTPAHAASPPPDVELFVEPTLRHAAEDIAALFRARTGVPVRFFSAPTALMIRQIKFTLCDVMILQGDAMMDQAIAGNVADGATRIALGRNHLVLARRGAGPAAVPSLQGVRADGAVAVVDAPVAEALGGLSHQVLDAAGWPGATGLVLGVATGADALYLLDTGAAKLAVVYRTDVAATKSLSVVADLPDATPVPVYSAALSRSVNSPNARAFLAFLASPQARAIFQADGLDTAP
jgi:molybdate transport system substrate-binding protein